MSFYRLIKDHCGYCILHVGRPAKRSLQKSSLEKTRAWTRSCATCSDRKGLIFLMLYKANLQDWAFVAIFSVKLNWSSITTPRFLVVLEGVMVEEPTCIEKLRWSDGLAETMNSSVLARLSWRWWSFIQLEMSLRQAAMRAAFVGSSGWNEK